jgi:hypothetical protein
VALLAVVRALALTLAIAQMQARGRRRRGRGFRRRVPLGRLALSGEPAHAPRLRSRVKGAAGAAAAGTAGLPLKRPRAAAMLRCCNRREAATRSALATSLLLVRSGHGIDVTPSGVRGPGQSTTRRDRICLRGEVGGRAPGDALGPTWEHRAPTAGTIAFVFSPARSGRVQWRHTDHAGRRHRRDRFATIPIARYRPAVADAVSAASRKQGGTASTDPVLRFAKFETPPRRARWKLRRRLETTAGNDVSFWKLA